MTKRSPSQKDFHCSEFLFLEDGDKSHHKHGKQDHWDVPDILKHILNERMKAADLECQGVLYPRCYRGIGFTTNDDVTKAVISIKRADNSICKERSKNECKLYKCKNDKILFQFYLSMRNWHAGRFHLKLYLVDKDNKKEYLINDTFTMKSKAVQEPRGPPKAVLKRRDTQPEWLMESAKAGLHDENQTTKPSQRPKKKQKKTPPGSPEDTPSTPVVQNPHPVATPIKQEPKEQIQHPIQHERKPKHIKKAQRCQLPPVSSSLPWYFECNEPVLWDPLTAAFGDLPCTDVSKQVISDVLCFDLPYFQIYPLLDLTKL